MATIFRNKLVDIRSDFRDEGNSDTDFTVHLENHANHFNGTHLCYLKRCTIPHSWYNIGGNGDEQMKIVEIGFSAQLVTFPAGSYTYSQFGSQLETILNQVATTNASGRSYTVTHSDITGKYSITEAGGNQLQIDLSYSQVGNTSKHIADHIGIPRNSSWTNLPATPWVSQKVADVFGTKSLYLSLVGGTAETTWENDGKGTGRNIIAEIQVHNNKYDIINFFNSDPDGSRRVFRNPGKIPLHFRLLNDDGDTVNLNGLPCKFLFNFQSVN